MTPDRFKQANYNVKYQSCKNGGDHRFRERTQEVGSCGRGGPVCMDRIRSFLSGALPMKGYPRRRSLLPLWSKSVRRGG